MRLGSRAAGWATGVAAYVAITGAAWALRPPDLPVLMGPGGRATRWQEWIESNGPAGVVVWASWAPRSAEVLGQRQALAEACQRAGLGMVIIAVQEPIEESRRALGADRGWFHDRHGAILKAYRVIRVPSMLIVAADGKVVERMEASVEAVEAWSAR